MFLSLLWAISSSTDCNDAINFARGLNMHLVQPLKFASIVDDCCSINTGISCLNERPSHYSWSSMNLNGTINSTALSSQIYMLNLNTNNINGTIPSLPSYLGQLYLYGNKLSGSLPTVLPNLIFLYIHYNYFTGQLPRMPINILSLSISGALETNNLYGEIILNKPISIYIQNMFVTNLVVYNIDDLESCNISNTPLLGNPNLSNLQVCTKNGLYSTSTTSLINSTTTSAAIATSTTNTASSTSLITSSTLPPSIDSTIIVKSTTSVEDHQNQTLTHLNSTLLYTIEPKETQIYTESTMIVILSNKQYTTQQSTKLTTPFTTTKLSRLLSFKSASKTYSSYTAMKTQSVSNILVILFKISLLYPFYPY